MNAYEVASHIEQAHKLISQIPVTDVHVDMMALARNHLFRALEILRKDVGPDGGQEDRRTSGAECTSK